MRIVKRLSAVLLVFAMTVSLVACGQKQKEVSVIDDVAATRGIDEDTENIYIDDNAIALAGEFESSEQALAAAMAAFNLVNQYRTAAGLPGLEWSEPLKDAALVRAKELVDLFSHDRPNGSPWYTVNSNIQFGENLAKLYYTSDSVVTAWMNSPTHAANIMDAGFRTVGIAIYQSENGNWYWAQEFGY